MSLEVTAEDGETEVLGKDVKDLQSKVVVNDAGIQGTLKYVSDYTGYSGDPELQKGNFICLKAEATEGATVTVQLLGGAGGIVTLDSDMNAVIRVTNKDKQKIKFVATKSGESVTKIFDLSMLDLKKA